MAQLLPEYGQGQEGARSCFAKLIAPQGTRATQLLLTGIPCQQRSSYPPPPLQIELEQEAEAAAAREADLLRRAAAAEAALSEALAGAKDEAAVQRVRELEDVAAGLGAQLQEALAAQAGLAARVGASDAAAQVGGRPRPQTTLTYPQLLSH